VLAIEWSETVGGQGQRNRQPIEQKLQELAWSNPLEVGIKDGRPSTPGGLIETQAIEREIRELIAGARVIRDFDSLPIPFRAVATDMVAGDMTVLDGGDLASAMRASMAIPGAFAPVIDGERVMVDGGLMRNLPVDVVRDLCADVVIAVWLTTPQPERDEVSSALSVVGRSLDVVIRANEREQIATLTEADTGISVYMEDITTADFQRAPDAIALGRRAAEEHSDELLRYAVSEEQYAEWRQGLTRVEAEPETLAEVRFTGLDRVSEEYLSTQVSSSVAGATVSPEQIEADAQRLYALGDFEQVDYRLSGSNDRRVLEFLPHEKVWGPNFLRLNLGAATDSSGDIIGLLRIDHTKTWINDRGAQWHNALQLGGQSVLRTDFYQPLDTRQRFFIQPIGQIESKREDLYIGDDRVAQYWVRELYAQIDAGINARTTAYGIQAQLVRSGSRYGFTRSSGIGPYPRCEHSAARDLRHARFSRPADQRHVHEHTLCPRRRLVQRPVRLRLF
jgi:NTE family protein